ncbi:Chitinase A1 precursor [Caulifigura coniformis]|uniref:chitinase n=1 Tax=Caulifigura coniformis TaxID=2527983 RepID=A0A517SFH8_9PLAN|nr:glycosyl hydrolase family 18 protein [Caulifigura coniformis]QDT54879.1 Chitinase A1 precursor [Caulifigura coniformis]
MNLFSPLARIRPRLALLAITAAALSAARCASAADFSEFRVIAYLPEYRAAGFETAQAQGLTDLIVFAAAAGDDGLIDMRGLQRFPWERAWQLKKETRARLILCVGGWSRSKGFPAVAADATKRKAFAASAVKICLEKRLDGVDLDWEHPKNAAEEEDYGKLLADMKTAFAPHGLMLSATVAGWQKLTDEAIASVDAIQLMSYDHGGKHSTLEDAMKDVQKLLDRGVPASRLVLGVPFYGRGITDRDRATPWREIVEKQKPAAGVDEADGLYFNGPETIRKKTRYALEKQLQGVMAWELGQDAPEPNSLLNVIETEVHKPR